MQKDIRMLRCLIKSACRFNNRSRGYKRRLWKSLAAKVVYGTTTLFIKSAIHVAGRSRGDLGFVNIATSQALINDRHARKAVDDLTAYINRNVEYWPMSTWLHPSQVLRLGIGDCKNQSSLLQVMLERCGIESELIVGVTNRFADEPDVHAWVHVKLGNLSLICDPVISDRAMSTSEYEGAVDGYIDITPEYLLKEPMAASCGVGKISYRCSD